MMLEPIDFENVDSFTYKNSVFIEGNLPAYLDDLESYFRKEAYNHDELMKFYDRQIKQLDRDVKSDLGFNFIENKYGTPIKVNKENFKYAKVWLSKKAEYSKKMNKAQRINAGKILNVIEDGLPLESMDLTNYSYEDHVIRIGHSNDGKEYVRIRVFGNGIKDYGESFAKHANNYSDLRADVRIEPGVNEKMHPISHFLDNNKLRISKLRVKTPRFEINKVRNGIRYVIEIDSANKEMLQNIGERSMKPSSLRYNSRSWSMVFQTTIRK